MGVYDTEVVADDLEHCDDINELKEKILPKLQSQRSQWQEKIVQIMSDSGYSCKDFSALCKVSDTAVRKWMKGSLPQSRDMFIRIGFAAGYGLDQMNAFLQRYGKCPQLYVKSLEDSVCIFVLKSKNLPHTYKCYEDILACVRAELDTHDSTLQFLYNTSQISSSFANINSLAELINFVNACIPSYRTAYNQFYEYVLGHIQSNLYDIVGDRYVSLYSLVLENKWSSSLYHCVSEIRNKKWFPLRHKVISLGLHLNMDLDEINQMLRYAKMEPLYPKNPIEAAISFALVDAKLNDMIFKDGSKQLYLNVKDTLSQLELEESEYFIGDL